MISKISHDVQKFCKMHKRRAMFLICFGLLAIGLAAGDSSSGSASVPHPNGDTVDIKNGGQYIFRTAFNSIHSHLLLFNFNKKKTRTKLGFGRMVPLCSFFLLDVHVIFGALFLFGWTNTHTLTHTHAVIHITTFVLSVYRTVDIYFIHTCFFTFASLSFFFFFTHTPFTANTSRAFHRNVQQFRLDKLPTISIWCSLLTDKLYMYNVFPTNGHRN